MELPYCEEELKKIGDKVSRYFVLLKEMKETTESLQSFLSIVHLLLAKQQEDPIK